MPGPQSFSKNRNGPCPCEAYGSVRVYFNQSLKRKYKIASVASIVKWGEELRTQSGSDLIQRSGASSQFLERRGKHIKRTGRMIGAGATTHDSQAALKTEQGKKRQEDQGRLESRASQVEAKRKCFTFILMPNPNLKNFCRFWSRTAVWGELDGQGHCRGPGEGPRA